MLPDAPDDLKFMLPYLQRASELKMKDPVMSYYCTFYAANIALKKGYPKNQVNDGFLMALLDELGAEKEALIEEDAMKDNEAGKRHVLQFALKVFLAADNEDRAGQATKKTARFFFIAAQFLEVLRVFGDDAGEEVEERIRYAKWKASDIAKAINEGRQPQPGPPTAESGASVDIERRGSNEANLPSMTGSYQPPPPPPPPPPVQQSPPQQPRPLYAPPPPPVQQVSPPPMQQQHNSPPPAQHQPPPPPQLQTPPQRYSPPVLSDVDPAKLADAEKHSRYAISALQFEDVPTAIRELEHALSILRR